MAYLAQILPGDTLLYFPNIYQQEESARERALCQLTECFGFVKVIMRGKHNYQGKGCTEIQQMVTEQHVLKKFRS